MKILKKYFKNVNEFDDKEHGGLSGYEMEGLIGFDHLYTSVILLKKDYEPGKFWLRDAFLDYAYSEWDYLENEESDMRNEAVKERIFEIAKMIEKNTDPDEFSYSVLA